jgi:hypothetical protein
MPREQQNGDGIFRTEPQMSVAESPPKPRRARARAEPQKASDGDGSSVFSEPQFDVLTGIIADTQTLAEKQLRAAIVALREEAEITVAVCRDELLAKIDAKNFGAALLDETCEIAKRAVHALRSDLDERAKITRARLDVVSDRLDAVERANKKGELDAWKGFISQLARQHAKLNDHEATLGAVMRRLDQLTQAVRDLYEGLGEQPPRALLPLALPAPSA